MRSGQIEENQRCVSQKLCRRGFGGDLRLKLLVTGGAGYIGSVVALQLVESGHEVTVTASF